MVVMQIASLVKTVDNGTVMTRSGKRSVIGIEEDTTVVKNSVYPEKESAGKTVNTVNTMTVGRTVLEMSAAVGIILTKLVLLKSKRKMSVLAFSTVVLRQSGIRGQNGLTGTNVFSEEINHGIILMVFFVPNHLL